MPKPLRSDSLKEVIERPCIRCHQVLVLDGGQLIYCSNCGAPQLFLSEELREQAALESQRYLEQTGGAPAASEVGSAGEAAPTTRRARRELRGQHGRWPLAIEYALLSSGIALGLDVGGLLFAPLLFVAWLWIVSAPIITVGFYNGKLSAGKLTANFAARLGLLTGLLVVLGGAVVFTGGMLISRYVFHSHTVDTQVAEVVTQLTASARAQNAAAAPIVIHMIGIPEFRVGLLLWMLGTLSAVYLLISMATAGLTGVMLSRRKAA